MKLSSTLIGTGLVLVSPVLAFELWAHSMAAIGLDATYWMLLRFLAGSGIASIAIGILLHALQRKS